MNRTRPDNGKRDAAPEGSPPGYLYHKQHPSTYFRPVRPSQPKKRKRAVSGDISARDVFWANVFRFGIVTVVMIVLLGMAIYVPKKAWQLKEARVAQTSSPVQSPLPAQVPAHSSKSEPLAVGELAQDPVSDETVRNYLQTYAFWHRLENPWGNMADVYQQTTNFSQAIIARQLSFDTHWDSPELFNELGICHLRLRNYDAADRQFRTALLNDRDYAPAHFNLALVQIARGWAAQARPHLERYLLLTPEDPKALKEHAALDAADGFYSNALKSLDLAIAIQPGWSDLYFDAATVTALMTQRQNTVRYLVEALKHAPIVTVYQIYQEPVFKDLRLSDEGRDFDTILAVHARKTLTTAEKAAHPDVLPKPISSEAGR